MGKVLNFDQFMSEKKKETIKVTIFGKLYEVPCEIPAIVPVMMARAEESSLDAQASTRMVMLAADALLGKTAVDEICGNGMTAKDLGSLVQQLFKMINGTANEGDDDTEEYTDEDSRSEKKGDSQSKK